MHPSFDLNIGRTTRPGTCAIIFSKDRPLQVEATIRSYFLHCTDPASTDLKVLYAASSDSFRLMYRELESRYPSIQFVREQNFAFDFLQMLRGYEFFLSLVDDNIFVEEFSLQVIAELLRKNTDTLAFSLRLGRNTTTCYALNRPQPLPLVENSFNGIFKFDWTKGTADFNYPMDLSSSVYSIRVIAPLFLIIPFKNPNSLEGEMAARSAMYAGIRPKLLCFEKSRAFCAPINKVQNSCDNRAGNRNEYSAEALGAVFASGRKINVDSYRGYTPSGCHEEVELLLE